MSMAIDQKRYFLYFLSLVLTISLLWISLSVLTSYDTQIKEDLSAPYETGVTDFVHPDNTFDRLHYQLQNPSENDQTFMLWIETDKILEVDIVRDSSAVDQNASISNKGLRFTIDSGREFNIYHAIKYSFDSFVVDNNITDNGEVLDQYFHIYDQLTPILGIHLDPDHHYNSQKYESALQNARIGALVIFLITAISVSRTSDMRKWIYRTFQDRPYKNENQYPIVNSEMIQPFAGQVQQSKYPDLNSHYLTIVVLQIVLTPLLSINQLTIVYLFIGTIIFYVWLTQKFSNSMFSANATIVLPPFASLSFPLVFIFSYNNPISFYDDVKGSFGQFVFLFSIAWFVSCTLLYFLSRWTLGQREEVEMEYITWSKYKFTSSQFFHLQLFLTLIDFMLVFIVFGIIV